MRDYTGLGQAEILPARVQTSGASYGCGTPTSSLGLPTHLVILMTASEVQPYHDVLQVSQPGLHLYGQAGSGTTLVALLLHAWHAGDLGLSTPTPSLLSSLGRTNEIAGFPPRQLLRLVGSSWPAPTVWSRNLGTVAAAMAASLCTKIALASLPPT